MNQKRARNVEVQEKELQQSKNFELRIITIPKQIKDFHYYSKHSLLVDTQYNNILFYSIDGDEIKLNMQLTKYIQSQSNTKYQTLCLDNHIIVQSEQNIYKFNLDQQGMHEIFNSVPLTQHIKDYNQINRKSFIAGIYSDCRLRVYLLKNLKIQNTLSNKFDIDWTTYSNHLVQSRKFDYVYYFNIQMTKQIRKFIGISEYLHRLNSNYLFVTIFKEINRIRRITHIKIYNICDMKLKGTIELLNRKEKLQNFIYIKDFNILAVYYPNRYIDLYDFKTLQFKRTEKLNRDYNSQLKHDEEYGLILFQMRDIYNMTI